MGHPRWVTNRYRMGLRRKGYACRASSGTADHSDVTLPWAPEVKAIGELRAGLAALVDALPKCDAVTVRGPDMSRLCGKPSTHYEVGAWGGECPCPTIDARCDEHKEHFEEAPWSAPLRAALRLLGRES